MSYPAYGAQVYTWCTRRSATIWARFDGSLRSMHALVQAQRCGPGPRRAKSRGQLDRRFFVAMTVPLDSPTPTSPLLPPVSPRRRPFYKRALPILITLSALLCITLLILHRYHLLPESDRGSSIGSGGQYPDSLELEGPLSPYLHDPSICVVEDAELGGTIGDIAETGRTYTLVSSGIGLPIRTSRDRIVRPARSHAFAATPSSRRPLAPLETGAAIYRLQPLQTWVDAGHIFQISAPNSTIPFTGVANGNLWAPDITYIPGKGYWVYYAASRLGSQNSGIFLAWSATEIGRAHV